MLWKIADNKDVLGSHNFSWNKIKKNDTLILTCINYMSLYDTIRIRTRRVIKSENIFVFLSSLFDSFGGIIFLVPKGYSMCLLCLLIMKTAVVAS